MNIAVSGLTGAAAIAPAAATALFRLPVEGDDAELLALGQKLHPLAADLNAIRAIDSARRDEFNRKLAVLGLKDEEDSAAGGDLERQRPAFIDGEVFQQHQEPDNAENNADNGQDA